MIKRIYAENFKTACDDYAFSLLLCRMNSVFDECRQSLILSKEYPISLDNTNNICTLKQTSPAFEFIADGNGTASHKKGFLAKNPGGMWLLYINDRFVQDEKRFLEELESAGLYKSSLK